MYQREAEAQLSAYEGDRAHLLGGSAFQERKMRRDQLINEARHLEEAVKRLLDTPDFPNEIKKKHYR